MGKDTAKVLTGIAGVELVNHFAMAFCNLPFHCFGISVSRPMNTIVLIAWILIFAASIYYAWFKKKKK